MLFFSVSALLLCDAMAYLFEGRPGRLGCWTPAIGSVWKPAVEDVAAFLHEADERMYREKEKR